jgi:hypothetical protein
VDGEHTYLTMYQLEDEHVLQTDAYLQHRHDPSPWTVRIMTHHPFIRSVYRQVFVADAGGRVGGEGQLRSGRQQIGSALLHVMMNVESGWDEEVSAWYESERIPYWLSQPGVVSARRFALTSDAAWEVPAHRVRGGQLDAAFYRSTVEGEYQYLTAFELEHEAVVGSSEIAQARTEVSDLMRKLVPHYRSYRSIYRQHFPAAGVFEDRSGPDSTNRYLV